MKINKGFTLVELIVVIAVLALLAIGAVIAVQNIQRNARISAASSDAARLADSLNTYNSSVAIVNMIANVADLSAVVDPIVGAGQARIPFLIPVDGYLMSYMDFSISFGTPQRLASVSGWIQENNGIWQVDAATVEAAVG